MEETMEETMEEPKEEPKPVVASKKKPFSISIDTRGDVILEVGPPSAKRSLRVSSKALSLGSPVFAAMLNSTFMEGAVPADGSPRSIPLPEDDPRAVTTLCNVLHHQSDYVRVETFKDLDRLAILCDKYDCARALRPWTTLWLQKWGGSLDGEDDHLKMLYISYAFKDRAAFYTASDYIVSHYNEDQIAGALATSPELILPENVLNGLQERRRAIGEDILKGINKIIDRRLEDARSKISIRVSREESCFSTAKTGSYFLELARLGLWPISEKLQEYSLDEVFDKLKRFRDYSLEAPKHRSSVCKCNTCVDDFQYYIDSVVAKQTSRLSGLCLTCVGSGRTSKATGNCQHSSKCVAADYDGISTSPDQVDAEVVVPVYG